MRRLSWCVALCSLFAAACGSDAAVNSPPEAKPVTPATAPESGASTAATSTEDVYIEVVYAGDGCTASGPDALPIGRADFVVTNLTEDFLLLYVGPLDEGYDYQDLADLQAGPGDMFSRPPWVHHAVELIEAPTLTGLRDNQVETAFLLDQPELNWAIFLVAGQEENLWLCSALDVTA